MDEAVALKLPICVYENTGADEFLQKRYPQIRRVPFPSELETFQALNDGLCEINVAYYQNWLGFSQQEAYNPRCDLEWVGRNVRTIQSGFATSVDTGYKCTSLVGNVLDVHLNEMELSGIIDNLWDEHYAKTRDLDCNALSSQVLGAAAGQQKEDGSSTSSGGRRSRQRRRMVGNDVVVSGRHRTTRTLKSTSRSAAAGGAAATVEDADASTLTLKQMAGTFVLHFSLTAAAIVIGYISRYFKQKGRSQLQQWSSSSTKTLQRLGSTCGGVLHQSLRQQQHGNKENKNYNSQQTTSTLLEKTSSVGDDEPEVVINVDEDEDEEYVDAYETICSNMESAITESQREVVVEVGGKRRRRRLHQQQMKNQDCYRDNHNKDHNKNHEDECDHYHNNDDNNHKDWNINRIRTHQELLHSEVMQTRHEMMETHHEMKLQMEHILHILKQQQKTKCHDA